MARGPCRSSYKDRQGKGTGERDPLQRSPTSIFPSGGVSLKMPPRGIAHAKNRSADGGKWSAETKPHAQAVRRGPRHQNLL